MVYGMRASLKKLNFHRLRIGQTEIERVHSFKYLGVIMDATLSFGKHIENIKNIYVFKLFLFAKLQVYLEIEPMLLMYKMYVLPYVDYGDILYDGAHTALLDKLQKLQNRSLRLVLCLENRTPVILIHQIAKISNLSVRRIAHLRNFMYKQQGNNEIVNTRNVNTRAHDAVVFTTLRPKNEKYRNSVLYRGAVAWNNLPVKMKNIPEYQAFKLQQKKWMCSTNYV